MMQEKWKQWMRRSDCILGISADQGGSWLSPIRENGPQPSVTPAADARSWAIGAGLPKPEGMETLFEFPAGSTHKCGTALDLRGSTDSLTICIDFEVDPAPETMTHRWWPILFAQGFPHAGYAYSYSAGVWLRKDDAEKSWECYGSFANGVTQCSASAKIADPGGGRHQIIVIRDMEKMTIQVYYDHQKVAEKVNENLVLPLTSEINASGNPEMGMSVGGWIQSANLAYESAFRVEAVMVFDRAFSAEEVAALY